LKPSLENQPDLGARSGWNFNDFPRKFQLENTYKFGQKKEL